MLNLAVSAQLPIVAVTTRDVLNLPEVLKEVTGRNPVKYGVDAKVAANTLYYVVPTGSLKPDALGALYGSMTKAESTLLIVNPSAVVEPMFDAGEVPVPRSLLMKMMMKVVNNEKRAEELLRGFGGCTIKEAVELCRLTMARDKSLTSAGIMATRKASFQTSKGLTQVDTKQDFYDPPKPLATWLTREKPFFLASPDPRLRPRGLLMDGPPGCVAEGTLIGVRRGVRNSSRTLPVEILFEKFNGLYRGRDPWRKPLDTFVQSWHAESGAIVYNRVEGVFDKGLKACLRISVDGCGDVILTEDHPVLNSKGVFVRADSLKPGSFVLVKGSMLPENLGLRVRRARVVVEGLKFYEGGWRKDVWEGGVEKVYEYKRQHRARLMVEAHLNGVSYDEFIHALNTDPVKAAAFVLLPDNVDVHHIDENPLNDVLTNLQVLNRDEHYLLHSPRSLRHFNVNYTKTAFVTSIEDAGVRRTFDLSMGEPAANFVVNEGIIVHNTGKTAASKWIAAQLGVPLYRIDIGGTKNKYVGTSEANMLTNLHRVDQEEPCVVLLDEVEKIFVQGGGDNTGVVQTMLSQMLWWLQEHKSRVLTIMTTNNVKVIPPELYREGRIDEVLYFGGLIHDEAVPFVQHALSVYSLKGVTSEALKQAATKICADLFPGSATGVLSQAALSKAVQVFVKQNLKKGLAS